MKKFVKWFGPILLMISGLTMFFGLPIITEIYGKNLPDWFETACWIDVALIFLGIILSGYSWIFHRSE